MQTQQPPPAPDLSTLLYDRVEAAARLAISIRTMDDLIARRAIEFVKIGRSVRLRPQALVSFIEANTHR